MRSAGMRDGHQLHIHTTITSFHPHYTTSVYIQKEGCQCVCVVCVCVCAGCGGAGDDGVMCR